MKIGDIVATVVDFSKLGRMFDVEYPKLHSSLVISKIEEHPCEDIRDKGIVLLYFEEHPKLHGLCDKDSRGKSNFVICELPSFVNETLKQ